MLLELIQPALILAIVLTIFWKSRQPAMTKEEQEFELEVVSRREHSFLTNTTKQSAYNGVEG